MNRVYKAGIERSWDGLGLGCAGYLVGVVYLPLDMNAKWVVKSSLSIALMKMLILCATLT